MNLPLSRIRACFLGIGFVFLSQTALSETWDQERDRLTSQMESEGTAPLTTQTRKIFLTNFAKFSQGITSESQWQVLGPAMAELVEQNLEWQSGDEAWFEKDWTKSLVTDDTGKLSVRYFGGFLKTSKMDSTGKIISPLLRSWLTPRIQTKPFITLPLVEVPAFLSLFHKILRLRASFLKENGEIRRPEFLAALEQTIAQEVASYEQARSSSKKRLRPEESEKVLPLEDETSPPKKQDSLLTPPSMYITTSPSTEPHFENGAPHPNLNGTPVVAEPLVPSTAPHRKSAEEIALRRALLESQIKGYADEGSLSRQAKKISRSNFWDLYEIAIAPDLNVPDPGFDRRAVLTGFLLDVLVFSPTSTTEDKNRFFKGLRPYPLLSKKLLEDFLETKKVIATLGNTTPAVSY